MNAIAEKNERKCLAGDLSDHFGRCPKCTEPNDHLRCLNVGRVHFYMCRKHKVCWSVGSNLFSSWRDETEEDWERNDAILRECEAVEPIYCQCPKCIGPSEPTATDEPADSEFAIPF